MEQEPFNLVKTEETKSPQVNFTNTTSLENFSFIRSHVGQEAKENRFSISRGKLAILGAVLGGLSLVSWVVILLGVAYSIFGIILSVIGLKSKRQKLAKVGLVLSIIGLILSACYIFAVYQGMINYNYFTSEFWTKQATEQVEK